MQHAANFHGGAALEYVANPMSLRPRLLRACLVCLALPRLASAHELGTVQVEAAFLQGGTYRIEVLVDLEHLTLGVGPDSGVGADLRIPALAPEIAERYGIFLRDYLTQSMLAFDWKQVTPEVESVGIGPKPGAPPDDLRPFLQVRLRGPVPPGASKVVWSNSVKIGTYLLTLRQDGDETVSRQFLEARQESNPFLLGPQVVPPTRFQELFRSLPPVLAAVAALGAAALFFRLRRRRAEALYR
jgi:hypothetical protein